MPNVPSAKVAAAKIALAKANQAAVASESPKTRPSAAKPKGKAKVVPAADAKSGTKGSEAASKKNKPSKNRQSEPTTAERRRAIEKDVQEFLKAGQKIEQVPTGVSGQDRFGRSKHIVLGRGKSR
jgi:hypothetical protein